MSKNINKEKAFNDLHKDYINAKSAKVIIDKLIAEWNDLYYGIRKDDKNKKLLIKEVAKVVEMQKPNITEPFLHTNNPVKISKSGYLQHEDKVEIWLNSMFTGSFNREDFMSDLVDLVQREGTAWIRTGWNYKERNSTKRGIFSMQELLQNEYDIINIKQLDNNSFDVMYNSTVIDSNCPTARVCRNENCFPDNTARTEEEMKFFIEKTYKTYYDIVNMNLFDKKQLATLKSKMVNSGNSASSFDRGALEIAHDTDGLSYGVDPYKTSDILDRKKVQFIEYFGYYDLYDNGKEVPIVAYWIEEFRHLIHIEENPYPSKRIPYFKANYSRRANSLWGNSVAFFLGENQNVKNGLIKGVLDNMALANNGQKFIMRGALDVTEFMKLKNRNRYIMVNKPDGVQDGSFNQIPASTFNILQLVSNETDQMSGVSAMAPALTQDNINKANGNGLTMSQQKMASLVRSISGTLSKVFKEWLTMAEVFLDDEQILELFTDDINGEMDAEQGSYEDQLELMNKYYDVNIFKNSSKTKLTVTVGTDVAKMQKLQQLNMLMQQTKALGDNQVPPESIRALVSEMFDLFDMHDEASELRTYVHKPSQMEQMMQQMQIQDMQLELAKKQAEIAKIQAETDKAYTDADNATTKTFADMNYKQAQSQEKMAKTESHRVDSMLRPAESYMNMKEQAANTAKGDKVNDGNN